MCGKGGIMSKFMALSGARLASKAINHTPLKKVIPKPIRKAEKFISRGGIAGTVGRSLFGD
jgi:hypothetical protein